jgi:hypothetical protein
MPLSDPADWNGMPRHSHDLIAYRQILDRNHAVRCLDERSPNEAWHDAFSHVCGDV